MLGAGIEPAFGYPEKDFKSLASTHFAIRALMQSAWRSTIYETGDELFASCSRVDRGQPAGTPSTLTAYQTE